MFTLERQKAILEQLKKEKSVKVTDLARQFYIGEATIRRDLFKLEKQGLLARTYGGALLAEGAHAEIPPSVRETERRSEKEHIGHLAAELVEEGSVVILDSSSTVLRMVPHLASRVRLTAITNGARTALELGGLHRPLVYCTGGKLRENSFSFTGQAACDFIRSYRADFLFFSCRGVSLEGGLTEANEEEAELRRVMVKSATKTVLLCDHTKLGNDAFARIGDFNTLYALVTDRRPPANWMARLEEAGVKVLF